MMLATFISRLKLRRCAEVGSSPSVVGRIWIHGDGTLRIGNRVRLDASSAPIELYVGPGAEMILAVLIRPNAQLIRGGQKTTPISSSEGYTSRADVSRNAVNALKVADRGSWGITPRQSWPGFLQFERGEAEQLRFRAA
jgi:hypothetical protein